jgi:2-haloacid dehalogenase
VILTFDCYGTLLNMAGVDACLADLARRQGVDPIRAVATYSAYEDRLMYVEQVTPYTALIQANLAYVDMEMRTGDGFRSAYLQVLQSYQALDPFPDVNPALQQLHAAGHHLVLMSNSTQTLMAAHLKRLAPVIDAVITADDTGCYKPQPDFFAYVAQHLPAGEHVHVAHGFWWDIMPATRLGWHRIWINREQLTAPGAVQPLTALPDLSDLPAALEKNRR